MKAELSSRSIRALVVDDDLSMLFLVELALAKEGFACDKADNGEQAWKMLSEAAVPYQLLISDLKIPGRNGHSLVTQAMTLARRPVIAVLTGVTDARITKDLMTRGIDDIEFKPARLAQFAAKMRCLVERRTGVVGPSPTGQAKGLRKRIPEDGLTRISRAEFEGRLRSLERIPSISQAAVEVFKLALNPASNFDQLAGAVERDPSLIADVLKLANSSVFNPTAKKITDVERAVVRLGQKRVGELALSSAACSSIVKDSIPFFSLSDVWRKCMAAGICMEMLLDQIEYDPEAVGGLFCAAVLQPMGRIMLASIFPEVYERMLKQAERDRKPLIEHELQVFPESPSEAAAKALSAWGIPEEIYQPLRHTSQSFSALDALGDPLRRRVELIKTAALLGELAANRFDPWDKVDLPSASVLRRLEIKNIDTLLSQCRDDLEKLVSFGDSENVPVASHDCAKQPVNRVIAYKRLHGEAIDFVPHLLYAVGVHAIKITKDISEVEEPVIVNTLNAAMPQVVARLRSSLLQETIILADAENAERLQSYGRVVALPIGFGLWSEICSGTSPSAVIGRRPPSP